MLLLQLLLGGHLGELQRWNFDPCAAARAAPTECLGRLRFQQGLRTHGVAAGAALTVIAHIMLRRDGALWPWTGVASRSAAGITCARPRRSCLGRCCVGCSIAHTNG